MGHAVNYEIRDDEVIFINDVIISTQQLDALFRLKHKTTCIHSFLWMELIRIPDGQNSVTVRFNVNNFNRIKRALEILQETDALQFQTENFEENNLKRLVLKIFNIHPGFISIFPMI